MPTGKSWTNKTFCISKSDVEDLWPDLKTIAKREGISVSALIVMALKEYREDHIRGNYQTLLNGYGPDGEKSEGQREQEIMRFFEKRAREGFDTRFRDILSHVREGLGYEGRKAVTAAEDIAQRLTEGGIKVWR